MRRLCFPSYDAQLVWNHDAVPLSTSEWSITKLSVTVVDKPADPSEFTKDLFEEPLNNPVTASSEQSDLIHASSEHYLQQFRFASEGSPHNTYCRVACSCGGFVSSELLAHEDTLAYQYGK